MNSISLLPPSIKAQHIRLYRYKLYLIIATCLIIAMIAICGVLAINTVATNRRLQMIKTQGKTIESYIESNNDVFVTHNEINQLKSLIEKAMGEVPNWTGILVDIGEIRPKGIVTDIVKGNYDDSNTVITINGRADGQRSLVAYMENLDSLPNVEEVKCRFARQSIIDDTNFLEFEILVSMQQKHQYQLEDR